MSLFLDRHWDPIGLYGHEGDEAPEPGTEYRRYAALAEGLHAWWNTDGRRLPIAP